MFCLFEISTNLECIQLILFIFHRIEFYEINLLQHYILGDSIVYQVYLHKIIEGLHVNKMNNVKVIISSITNKALIDTTAVCFSYNVLPY